MQFYFMRQNHDLPRITLCTQTQERVNQAGRNRINPSQLGVEIFQGQQRHHHPLGHELLNSRPQARVKHSLSISLRQSLAFSLSLPQCQIHLSSLCWFQCAHHGENSTDNWHWWSHKAVERQGERPSVAWAKRDGGEWNMQLGELNPRPCNILYVPQNCKALARLPVLNENGLWGFSPLEYLEGLSVTSICLISSTSLWADLPYRPVCGLAVQRSLTCLFIYILISIRQT